MNANNSNHPADVLTIRGEVSAQDAINALDLATSHVRNTVKLVEMTLADAADDDLMVSPEMLAATLHGIETHLAVIDRASDLVWRSAQGSMSRGGDHG